MSRSIEREDWWDNLMAEVHDAVTAEGSELDVYSSVQELRSFMILYCDKGQGRLRCREQSFKLARQALYLLHPGTAFSIEMEPGAAIKLYIVTFDLYRAVERSAQRQLYERLHSLASEGRCNGPTGRIKQQLLLLAGQQHPSAPIRSLQRQQYIMELLQMLAPVDQADGPEPEEQWLPQVLRYIQDNFHRDIRVETLAEMAGLHPVYFSQQFKRYMNKSPSAFLTQLRMNRAKELLLVTDKNVREVAQFVGYRDEFYFSRRFKENTGSPPTFYTKRSSPSVVSLSYPCTDHLYTLGVAPRAAQLHESFAFDSKELRLPMHGSEAWEIGRDVFLELRPDLILCKDNVLAKAREHIGDIAPILSIPWTTMDVYGHLQQIALILDRKLNAQLWLDRYEQKVERGRKQVRQRSGGASLAIVVLRDNGLRLYSTRNVGHVFYRSLGLSMPDRIREQTERHAPGTGFNWTKLELQELPDYDADLLLLLVRSPEERAAMERALAADPLWRRHTAVRTKRYEVLDWQQWMVYAPSSLERQLEEAVALLSGGRLGT